MPYLQCFNPSPQSRRRFFQAAGAATLVALPSAEAAESPVNVFGPRPGYSPQIGTLVSEMIWMRNAVLSATKGLTQEQLDFLLDNKANRIGALLLHLAATEKLYQLNTFDNVRLDALEKTPSFKDWDLPMELGDPARQAIKGHSLDYYLNLLQEGREKTFAEFRKRDDAWLLSVDNSWGWGPTNNLCKWFHVCEHESHHTGQISLLRSRAPGAKS
ncbi:MAG TPA: DinB family protein [Bryobacteraceae bacterium]|nr:DinB family protein [Bryobacteraceae bacterium]